MGLEEAVEKSQVKQVLEPSEQQAFSEGLRAGRLRLAPSLNPFEIGSDLYSEWHRGWFSEVGPVRIV